MHKAVGKDHQVNNFVDGMRTDGPCSAQLLSVAVTIAGPLPKHMYAFWLVEFSCATVSKSLKEAIADATCVQSTIVMGGGGEWGEDAPLGTFFPPLGNCIIKIHY